MKAKEINQLAFESNNNDDFKKIIRKIERQAILESKKKKSDPKEQEQEQDVATAEELEDQEAQKSNKNFMRDALQKGKNILGVQNEQNSDANDGAGSQAGNDTPDGSNSL